MTYRQKRYLAVFLIHGLLYASLFLIARQSLPADVLAGVGLAVFLPAALLLALLSSWAMVVTMDRLADSDVRPNDTAPDQMDPDDPMARPLSDENWTEEMTAHFRAVVDISPDAIYINRQGRFAYVNQSAIDLFGAHSADDLIGKQVFSLMHEDDISPAKTRVRQLVKTGQTVVHDLRWHRLDGKEFLAESVASLIHSRGERSLVGIVRDITARREQEELQRQSQRLEAIGQLTGGVAHDFNNLLAVVIWNLEMLREDLEGDDDKLETLNRASRASQKGADLVKQLLAFSRRQTLRTLPIDLNKSVANATQMVAGTLGENITIATDFDEDLWTTAADPVQVENILLNLTLNARDAMKSGGVVGIKTENVTFREPVIINGVGIDPGEYASIVISDIGTGMPPDVASRAFEPFFTTKPVGEGTGLGLSTVYGFIRQSKGFVTLSSVVDEGTNVSIYLPRNVEQGVLDTDTDDGEENLETGKGEQVLIVEDNQEVLASMEKIVRGFGYQVHTATSGPEALAYLETLDPGTIDLMLTDIGLAGGMDGWELSARVRKDHSGLKVLYMSGYADDILARGDFSGNRRHLLRKPFRRVEISSRVREILDQDEEPFNGS